MTATPYIPSTSGKFQRVITLDQDESGNDIFADSGEYKVQIYSPDTSKSVVIDSLSNMSVAEPTIVVGASFEGTTLDSNFWSGTATNTGTYTQDGELELATGTAANSTVAVNSVRKCRKIPGTVNEARFVGHIVNSPTVNNIRRFGMYDTNNGAYFEVTGTAFNVGTVSGGTATLVSSTNFNGGNTFSLDTNIHRWVIDVTAFAVSFFIDGKKIHTVRSTTEPWTKSLTIPITFENNNVSGGTANNEMHFQVATILRRGRLRTKSKSIYQSGQTAGRILKYGAGEVSELIVSGVKNTSVITIYDNTAASGTILWSSGTMGAQTQPYSLDFKGVPFFIGLTLVISGADANITVVYE